METVDGEGFPGRLPRRTPGAADLSVFESGPPYHARHRVEPMVPNLRVVVPAGSQRGRLVMLLAGLLVAVVALSGCGASSHIDSTVHLSSDGR